MAKTKEVQTDIEEFIEEFPIPPKGESQPLFEQSVQARYLDPFGREIPNPVPMQPPVGYKKQPTMFDIVRQQIAAASREAAMAGAETEDEANDFDVGEDMDPETPYEHDFEPDPAFEVMLARQSAPPPSQTRPTDAAAPTASAARQESSPHQPHAPAGSAPPQPK